MEKTDVLIIGAGLSGLSAAYHLRRPFLLLEKEDSPGGLVRSVHAGGSTYDYTGHLLHLKGTDLEELVDELLPGGMMRVVRKAAIYVQDRFIPYPFQANFHPLPRDVVKECLLGYIRARESGRQEPDNFKDWALATFGEGICSHFMFPYNEKLFCRSLDQITADWVSWSVPRPGLETVIDGALGTTAEGLGYNPDFLYPKEGGIEVLPRALAERVGDIGYGEEVVLIDEDRRVVFTYAGREIEYGSLINTMPLPVLLNMLSIGGDDVERWVLGLSWVNVYNLNLTLRREPPWDWQWLYLPEPEFRCYRVGVGSNISQALAPPGCCTVYTEVSYRPEEPLDRGKVREEVLGDLRRLGLMENEEEAINEIDLDLNPAYVVHDRFRKENLDAIHEWLRARGIHSIGRWGRWEYSGMKDALLQGREAALMLNESRT